VTQPARPPLKSPLLMVAAQAAGAGANKLAHKVAPKAACVKLESLNMMISQSRSECEVNDK
jgi:hypothetical protein